MRSSTNRCVALRPVVLRDADSSNAVSASRYDYMRALRNDARIPERGPLPEVRGNPMPARPERPGADQPRQPAAIRQPGFSLSPDLGPGVRPPAPFSAEPPRLDTP